MDRVVFSWSGGKDGALALAGARRDPEVEVVELLTTVGANGRSSIHGVRRGLIERQAAALGLPLRCVELPDPCSNEEYEAIMGGVVADYGARGIDRMGFGDLFLEDVREYREERLAGTGIEGYWPVWGRPADEFVTDVLAADIRATVVCVDGRALDESFAGRAFDREFLDALPAGVDPCGENGEFHTFVHGGPGFDTPVRIEVGETVTRDVGDGTFHYADLRSREPAD